MLEIRRTNDEDAAKAEYGLYIDGALVDGVNVQAFGRNEVSIISTFRQDTTNKLLQFSLTELFQIASMSLQLRYEVPWNEAAEQLWFFHTDESMGEGTLFFTRISRWHRSYTLNSISHCLAARSRILQT